MRIEYLTIYKWEKLEDGTIEKFKGRIEALPWELSLATKFGCVDISMQFYVPKEMYNKSMQSKQELAEKEYKRRYDKLNELVNLIKSSVSHDKKINDEYLYELWISRIFELNWKKENYNPIKDIDIFIYELSKNNEINPYEINLDKELPKGKIRKPKRKLLTNIKSFFQH